jgi:hypothetical protein
MTSFEAPVFVVEDVDVVGRSVRGSAASCLVREKPRFDRSQFIAFLSNSAVASSFNFTAFLMELMELIALSQENKGGWDAARVRVMYGVDLFQLE